MTHWKTEAGKAFGIMLVWDVDAIALQFHIGRHHFAVTV